ncbi:MAG: HAD family hydrolase [Treponema sp.]|nr:HAD family hydrolase [Treponema sp.]
MKPGINAIAFDLDGTLYPNYRLNIRLIPFILKELRLMTAFNKARKTFRRNAGKNQGDFYAWQAAEVASIISAEPDDVRAKIEKFIYRGWEPYFAKVKLYNGVQHTLEAFRNAGLKLGLLSDFPPENKIKYLGLDSFWVAVLCTEEIGALKPDALPFIKLAGALAVAPGSMLYVGNSYRYDVIGAKNAGMRTALLTRSVWATGFPPGKKNIKMNGAPDFVFHDYRQLYNYVLH